MDVEIKRGFESVLTWCGRVAPGIVVVAALFGGMVYIIKSETADLRSTTIILSDKINKLDSDLKNTNTRIDQTLQKAFDDLVARPSGKTGPKAALEKGRLIVSLARTSNVKLTIESIREYGRTVKALTYDPSVSEIAWQNLTLMADYRSLLNADYIPNLRDLTPTNDGDTYRETIRTLPDQSANADNLRAFTVYFAGGHVAPAEGARMELLSDHHTTGSKFGLFVVEGGANFIVLDGMLMKNVIIRNAKIRYDGGPIHLQNVYFVNCHFVLSRTTPSRNLGTAIVEAAALNFSDENS